MFPENEVTQARRRLHEAIVQDLRQENPDSYMVLAVKHGVTVKTVYNIARANGLQRKDRRQEVANGSQTV
jgi:broad specificity phosphatase PhoE